MKCQLIPFLNAKHRHHYSYALYKVDYNANTVKLHPFSHWIIHGLAGGSIWMEKAVTRQNAIARLFPKPIALILKYPNPIQRLLHCWCKLPNTGKAIAALLIGFWMMAHG